ncbi:uncharacterized protein LOC135837553 [Planococcus citri]|uniref:uncharacterized protein LOC135837553 n=1 Tax=Planococcus citri TaxID=170843 RepID=UPI0031FA419B
MGDMEEYPFLFMNTPSSLQLLASTEVALMLWQYRCAASDVSVGEFGWLWWEKSVFGCEEILVVPVPSRIRSQIDEKISAFGKELIHWKGFHCDGFKYFETFSKCIKHMVLDFSGTIDNKATAMNILNSGEFGDVENYTMACLYCLEDQVRRFWPSVANESLVDENPRRDGNYWRDRCNLYYWNGVMKSEENSIDRPSERFRERWIEFASRGEDRAAFEQFYRMLPAHETLEETIFYLEGHECRAAIRTLPTLNRVQVEEVFEGKAHATFAILAMDGDQRFLQFARQSWTLARHLILADKWRFVSVVYVLWIIAFFPDDFTDRSYTRCNEVNELLMEIWSDASDELKSAVSKKYIHNFLDQDFEVFKMSSVYRRYSYGHDMKFIIDMLKMSRDVDKVSLWRRNWQGFALRSKASDFQQLMSLCLENNEDEIECYKKSVLGLPYLACIMIRNGLYSDLKDHLYFYSEDARHFQLLGKQWLEAYLDIILLHNDDDFAKFEWFVGELFSNEKKDVEEFKEQLISSAGSLRYLLAARRRSRSQIHSKDFSTLIGRLVTQEDEYNLVKRKLLEQCRSYPMEWSDKGRIACFNEWIEFLEWCIGDHEKHSAFKQSFNVYEIFSKLLSHASRWSSPDMIFLDEFLAWYFGNEEDSKNFKLDMIKKNYSRIDFVRTNLLSNCDAERYAVSSLLRWFFGNNTEDLRKFCENCNFILHPNVPL